MAYGTPREAYANSVSEQRSLYSGYKQALAFITKCVKPLALAVFLNGKTSMRHVYVIGRLDDQLPPNVAFKAETAAKLMLPLCMPPLI